MRGSQEVCRKGEGMARCRLHNGGHYTRREGQNPRNKGVAGRLDQGRWNAAERRKRGRQTRNKPQTPVVEHGGTRVALNSELKQINGSGVPELKGKRESRSWGGSLV